MFKQSKKACCDGGFTLIETMVALAIVSFLGLMIWNVIFLSSESYVRFFEKAKNQRVILQVDQALRTLSSRVETPYWLIEHQAEISPDHLSVSWLDGKEDSTFEIAVEEDALVIKGDSEEFRFHHILEASIQAYPDEEDCEGFSLEVLFKDMEEQTLSCSFGSQVMKSNEN